MAGTSPPMLYKMALRKKEKYTFNTHTLSYEKAVVGWGTRIFRFAGFLVAALVFSLAISTIYYKFFDSPKDKILKSELGEMKDQYYILSQEVDRLTTVLDELHYRDGNIYRVMFEAEPINDDEWQAGSGGVNKYRNLDKYDNGELIKDLALKIDKLKKQMVIQSKSYDQIADMIKNQKQMLTAIPSVQPIENKNLQHIGSGFGWRIDPIYKTQEFHKGMDFVAPTGTKVHVTGDGVVETVNYSFEGYGNEIIINHGYGYRTRYAHLSRFNVQEGQKVKRGDVIGYIGSTGKSTGPHLHYEVLKNGAPVNPVYYYYNDLKDAQFEKMIELSNSPGQSLD
ncbi:MAG TPA: M23 family metallopeptidase [Chitinophagales bacterium]|nr:M23 family metallopeptidase [Chitinophagales bacterium]